MRRLLFGVILFPLAYFLLTQIGLALAVPPTFFLPIWPAAGLALGALLVGGRRFAFSVWLGAFAANSLAFGVHLQTAVMALGPVLEGLVAATLVQRWCGTQPPFDSVKNLARFGAAVVLSTPFSVGVATLGLAGLSAEWGHWPVDRMLMWCLSDALGMLVLTPVVLLFRSPPGSLWLSRRRPVLATVVVGFFVTWLLNLQLTGTMERHQTGLMLRAAEQAAARLEVASREVEDLEIMAQALDGLPASGERLLSLAPVDGGLSEVGLFSRDRPPSSGPLSVALESEHGRALLAGRKAGVVAVGDSSAVLLVPLADPAGERLVIARLDLGALLGQVTLPTGYSGHLELEARPSRAWLTRLGVFAEAPVAVSGVTWTLQLFAPRAVLTDTWLAWAVLTLTLSITAVVSAMTLLLTGRTAQVEEVVKSRTAELQRAHDAAERANRAKGDFLATISHEIRTPMNGILGTASLLAEGVLDADQRSLVEILKGSGDSLLALVNNVLDVSRIEAGRLELESRPFDLRACLASVLALLRAHATAKSIALREGVAPSLPQWVLGDELRTRQVLLNLVANALKFTERGSITVAARLEENLVEIAIIDTGPGIPEQKQKLLFQAFSQLDASTTRRHGGSGLGLMICRSLTGLMGGSLSVSSTPGKGSTFTVKLPLRACPAPPSSAAGEETPTQLDCSKLRVLVAEDNPTNQIIVTRYLAKFQVTPVVVGTGMAAVREVREHAFDLVLMDLHMPELDGNEATRAIRALREAVHQPTIVGVSADAFEEARAASLTQGMDGYLTKPLKMEALRAVCERVLRGGAT